MQEELLRTHDNKAAGKTPSVNWECKPNRLKTSEYPCDARRKSNYAQNCIDCHGATWIGGEKTWAIFASSKQEKNYY